MLSNIYMMNYGIFMYLVIKKILMKNYIEIFISNKYYLK